jgi:hypothetical protein
MGSSALHHQLPGTPRQPPATEPDEEEQPGSLLYNLDAGHIGGNIATVDAKGHIDESTERLRNQKGLHPIRQQR